MPAKVAADQPEVRPERSRRKRPMFGPVFYVTLVIAAACLVFKWRVGGLEVVQNYLEMRSIAHQVKTGPAADRQTLLNRLLKMGDGAEAWIRPMLASQDPALRLEAARALVNAEPRTVAGFDALFKLLSDPDPAVSAEAPLLVELAMTKWGKPRLGERRWRETHDWYARQWSTLDTRCRELLLDHYATHRQEAKPILPWIESSLLSPNAFSTTSSLPWFAMLRALDRIAPDRAEKVKSVFIDRLADEKQAQGTFAMLQSTPLTPRLVQQLTRLLDHPNASVRERAAWLLANREIMTDAIKKILAGAMEDPDPWQRIDAMISADRIPTGPHATWVQVRKVIADMQADPNFPPPSFQPWASSKWPKEMAALRDELTKPAIAGTREARLEAIKNLQEIFPGAETLERLMPLATDPDPEIRIGFCRALASTWPRPKNRMQLLFDLLDDRDAKVALAAAEALAVFDRDARPALVKLRNLYAQPLSHLHMNTTLYRAIGKIQFEALVGLPEPIAAADEEAPQ